MGQHRIFRERSSRQYAEGKLAYEGAIDSNASPNPATIEGAENYVIAAVDSLIAGEEIATAQTQPYGCSVKYAY